MEDVFKTVKDFLVKKKYHDSRKFLLSMVIAVSIVFYIQPVYNIVKSLILAFVLAVGFFTIDILLHVIADLFAYRDEKNAYSNWYFDAENSEIIGEDKFKKILDDAFKEGIITSEDVDLIINNINIRKVGIKREKLKRM